MFFAQHSLLGVPCFTLLLFLLLLVWRSLFNTATNFATPYSTLFVQHSLFNIAIVLDDLCLTLLGWHYSCCSLFDVLCSMFLVWHCLFGASCLMLLLLFVWCYFFGTPCWCWCCYCYSLLNVVASSYSLFDITTNNYLLNVTTLLAIPCLTMLFSLLFLAQHCCPFWYSLLNIVAPLNDPLFIHPQHGLFMYLFGMFMMLLLLLVVLCSTLLLMFLYFR
jgi:hypothetical protein